jgi:hypothetical protein
MAQIVKIEDDERVLHLLESMNQMLKTLVEGKAEDHPSPSSNGYMNGVEIKNFLHIGDPKLKEMIKDGKIEVFNGYGPRGKRYRLKKEVDGDGIEKAANS